LTRLVRGKSQTRKSMSSKDYPDTQWKTRVYVLGTAIGSLFGLASAYLYSRATEEDVARGGGKLPRVQTGELLGLGLAALALVRQITEMGKSKKK
jgi:hypothetical protein